MTRTPEERLLSKRRLGSFYLADVRALIERAETAEARVAELEAALRDRTGFSEFDRMVAAEARVTELEAALRQAWDQLEELAGLRPSAGDEGGADE